MTCFITANQMIVTDGEPKRYRCQSCEDRPEQIHVSKKDGKRWVLCARCCWVCQEGK